MAINPESYSSWLSYSHSCLSSLPRSSPPSWNLSAFPPALHVSLGPTSLILSLSGLVPSTLLVLPLSPVPGALPAILYLSSLHSQPFSIPWALTVPVSLVVLFLYLLHPHHVSPSSTIAIDQTTSVMPKKRILKSKRRQICTVTLEIPEVWYQRSLVCA